jgi:hypothetical protein
MSTFTQRIRHLEIAADPDDGDGFKFVVARHGEDARLVRDAFHAGRNGNDCAVIVFTHDFKPRAKFCSAASVAAVLPAIEKTVKAMPDGHERAAEARFWVSLCEGASVAYGKTLLKLAGLD